MGRRIYLSCSKKLWVTIDLIVKDEACPSIGEIVVDDIGVEPVFAIVEIRLRQEEHQTAWSEPGGAPFVDVALVRATVRV